MMIKRLDGNYSIKDIRLLKVLEEYGSLSRRDFGAKYLVHLHERNLTGCLDVKRLRILVKAGYIKTEINELTESGLPEIIYSLSIKNAVDHYIDQI